MNNSDNKRKRVILSENVIKDMLAIFSEKNILTALDGNVLEINRYIMDTIESDMRAKGYQKTSSQIRTNGRDRKQCDWDDDLDDLLKTRPAIKPLSYGVDSTITCTTTDDENCTMNDANMESWVIEENISEGDIDNFIETLSNQEEKIEIRPKKSSAKQTSLAKTLEEFTNKWEDIQIKINRELLQNQKEIMEIEFQKQRKWEKEMMKKEEEISREERKPNQDQFKLLISALDNTSK
ncbi:Uncharacterized protein FWK35_00011552 [Aphis craccivora]|uniref:Uncharacterized protein n=1 Tax=Aphis craccivora TaxID=307492 RepID=A0A6G0YAY5_APHCR|nr:Uncharacterized protein FWK35_00011552 [Aphis craccivora]